MGRGTPLAQYGSAGGMIQPIRGNTPQQPMISDMAYRGPQQGNPNALTFARGPIPLDQQGPPVGGSIGALAGGLGQIPLQQQQMGQTGQNLFNVLRGQPATQQPMARPDPDFNINTAMNTFNQRLGDYVKSGRMSVADAQRAQAEMRALQLNPAGATRQQATEIAQRNLQVGQYSPANVAAQQAAQQRAMQQPMLSNLADRFRNAEGVVGPYTSAPRQLTQEEAAGITSMRPAPPPPDRQVIGFMTPPPGVRSGDTRVFADQPVTPPPTPTPTLPPVARTPAPTPAATPTPTPTPTPAATPGMPQGWNVSSAYRDFGGKLAQMIKSGQLTPQQANAIKDPAFQATKLGNTPEAFAAMQKALAGLTGYAAGGYATQVAPEDPRMQAMRYLQRLGK